MVPSQTRRAGYVIVGRHVNLPKGQMVYLKINAASSYLPFTTCFEQKKGSRSQFFVLAYSTIRSQNTSGKIVAIKIAFWGQHWSEYLCEHFEHFCQRSARFNSSVNFSVSFTDTVAIPVYRQQNGDKFAVDMSEKS
jgi:hypothetical protein